MKRATAVLVIVSTGTFVTTLDGASLQMALPVLHRALKASVAHVQWTMSAYLLVSTVALLPCGQAADLWGHERIWRGGLGLFTLASALCALATNLWILVGLRALQGVGAAMIGASSAPILVEQFPHAKAHALGLSNVAIGIGLVGGPPLVAVLTLVSWRLIFLAVVPFGVVAWLAARRHRQHQRRAAGTLDLLGGLWCGLGLAGVLATITMGRRWGWLSATTALVAGCGLASLVLFVVRERRSTRPLLPFDLLAQRSFLSGALTTLFGLCALFTMTIAVPFLLVTAQHRSMTQAGLFVAIVAVGLSVGAPLFGSVADRVGSRWPCAVGLALLGIGALLLADAASSPAGTLRMLVGLATVGIGFGGFQAPNWAAALSPVGAKRFGVATATLVAAQNLGMTLGVALSSALLDYRMAQVHVALATRAAQGTAAALEAGALTAFIGAGLALLRPPEDPRAHASDAGDRFEQVT